METTISGLGFRKITPIINGVSCRKEDVKDAGILHVIGAVQRNPSNFAMLGMGFRV